MCTSLASSSLYLINELLIPLFLPKLPTTSSKQVSHLPSPTKDGWLGEGDCFRERICRFGNPEAGERGRNQEIKQPVRLKLERLGKRLEKQGDRPVHRVHSGLEDRGKDLTVYPVRQATSFFLKLGFR